MTTKTFAERCTLSEQCLPDAPYRAMLTKLHAEMLQEIERLKAAQTANSDELTVAYMDGYSKGKAAAQPALPPMHASGLVAVKTLLSRDPCAHAKVAIEMIDEMLREDK